MDNRDQAAATSGGKIGGEGRGGDASPDCDRVALMKQSLKMMVLSAADVSAEWWLASGWLLLHKRETLNSYNRLIFNKGS